MKEETIFIQYSPKPFNFLEDSFLDLNFAFDFSDQLLTQRNFDEKISQNQDIVFEPFAEPNTEENSDENLFQEASLNSSVTQQNQDFSSNQISSKEKKYIAKSKKTKNICFNICQKTVKVIKTRNYHEKFLSICLKENAEPETVISNVLKCKKNLTGPKALEMFIQTDNSTSRVFNRFMKWFLRQKYLRHAINQGTMDDLKGYLEFKNSVILTILEK